MNKLLLLLMVLTLFVSACGDKREDAVKIKNDEQLHVNDDDEALELNDGKKWKVVDDMMIYLRNMEKAISEFETSESKDYKSLEKTLSQNVDSLVKNCSMEGKAHDELHKWLIPFIELADEFAMDEKKQNENFKKLKESFITFNKYFE